jgi:hypothetical protein
LNVFVTYLGWRRKVRELFGVNYGGWGKLKGETRFALGVSEKLSESCKGNFAGAEGGSLGMRQGEVVKSPISG